MLILLVSLALTPRPPRNCPKSTSFTSPIANCRDAKPTDPVGIRCQRHALNGQNCVVLDVEDGVSLTNAIDSVVHHYPAPVGTIPAPVPSGAGNVDHHLVVVYGGLLRVGSRCGHDAAIGPNRAKVHSAL